MYNENSMRTHLVTKFNCAECGSVLNISYEPRGKKNKTGYDSSDCSDKITGAGKVNNYIFIEPCNKCIENQKEIWKH